MYNMSGNYTEEELVILVPLTPLEELGKNLDDFYITVCSVLVFCKFFPFFARTVSF